MNPIINIVTRVSRKETFDRCYNSIHEQTYKNINHICTYQNDDIYNFLKDYENLNLLKVPNLKSFNNLYYSFNSHTLTDDFINPNWDIFDRKIELSKDYEIFSIPAEVKKFEKKISDNSYYFCYTPDFTVRWQLKHFPYNQFLKIAEKRFKDGWVIYIDDDDVFMNENSLKTIVDNIKKHDEDTIHIWKAKYLNSNSTKPSEDFWIKMSMCYPFVLNEVGGSIFTYHTKWSDWTMWDEWSGADYRTLKSLEKVIPNKNFIDEIIIHIMSN